MALRVWLPLNGTLENKGISDYVIQSANITIVDNGKIGKCYSFNGSSSYISITNFNLSNNWSYGCWINTPNSDSRGWEIAMVLNNSGSDADSQFAFWVHQKENRFESLANTQYTSTIPYTNYYNSWHHFFATFNGSLLTTYIDGNVVNTKTITAEYYPATNLTIGARSKNAAGTAFINWFQGYLNDVRVYDHCLSTKEVKEISQGLVLHYKLDGLSQGSGNNLVTGLTKGGQTTVVGNTIVTSGENADTYFKINLSSALILNKSYTIGIDAENLPDGGYFNFPIGAQNNTAGAIRLYNGHNELTFVANDTIVNCGTSLMMDDNARTAWPNQCIFKNFYIYENTSIADSSGYGHNGTIIGELSVESGSSRYTSAIHISSTSSKIHILNFPTAGFGNSYTFAWWAKVSSVNPMHWGFSDGIRLNGMYTGRLWNTGDGSDNPLYIPGTTTQVAAPTVNVWHHWVMTGDGTSCKVYQDGVYWGVAKTYKSISGTSIYINGWNNNTDYSSNNLSISDFRIYATALSAEDISDLYHTSANVDDLGNLHGFEMVETHDRELITGEHFARLGVASYSAGTAKFDENGASYTGKVWAPNGYINSDYIEIKNTGYTYYYDITYSNSGGGMLDIGFERFDANKTSTSNSSCIYIVTSAAEINNMRITGTVNLAKDVSGNDVKYIRIRVLTDWNNSSIDNSRTANIKYFSLKEVPNNDSIAYHIYSNGVYESDTISDVVPSVSRQLNTGLSEFNDFIEK